jgi:hypothetical protein
MGSGEGSGNPTLDLLSGERNQAVQEAEDKLKFGRMKRQGAITLREVVKVPAEDRTRDERFFLRMHLREHVPFFNLYHGYVLQNICDKLQ